MTKPDTPAAPLPGEIEDALGLVPFFTCPECGGHWFGSSGLPIESRHCHDEHQTGCRWAGPADGPHMTQDTARLAITTALAAALTVADTGETEGIYAAINVDERPGRVSPMVVVRDNPRGGGWASPRWTTPAPSAMP